jgi:hypothetical protein
MNNLPIHINRNRLNRNINLFFLLIPIILYVLIISLALGRLNNQEIAATEGPSILGEQDGKLDISP